MSERDLIGYGGRPPHPHWPNDARIAVQFVLNIEEGAESCVLHGDAHSETYLHELPGRLPREQERDLSVESMYEYGSRSGVWRILQLFRDRSLPLTAFAVGMALELNPKIGHALVSDGHEIAGHGYRWLDYHHCPEEEERQHIRKTMEVIKGITGTYPSGWYTGRCSQNTRRLLSEEADLLYYSDSYNDDLPYWQHGPHPHLVIPYTLVNNDVRYLLPNGCATSDDFLRLLMDSFHLLWQEGEHHPKMMSIGLHARISGHPARAIALAGFLDYAGTHDRVWICTREAIAKHWMAEHPYTGAR